MDRRWRGQFLIIGNKYFTKELEREGHDYDVSNLMKTFQRIGFKVPKPLANVTAADMLASIRNGEPFRIIIYVKILEVYTRL